MLKKIIKTLSNPILFYADKSGNSIFRNFCWLKNTGNLYKMTLPKQEVGKALEFRFELDKYLKIAYFGIPILIYLIFIHIKFTLWNLLMCEFWWLILICAAKSIVSYVYSKYLIRTFGKYEITEFAPKLPEHKWAQYRADFNSKIIAIVILLALFFAPALILRLSMTLSLKSKKPKYDNTIKMAKIYLALYPKTENIYDMRAYAKYMKHDYEGALEDYRKVLDISGKKFNKKDFTRFANLLLLEKKINGSENAVLAFNDFATRKKMSILEESQMLWIKSIFSIENDMPETIVQDYNDLLSSLDSKDAKNQFYISSDKAYILYLMQDYESAISVYNILISYAESNKKQFSKELQALYAERGFAKYKLGDNAGAQADFQSSKINPLDLGKYEPYYSGQEFVVGF